MSEFEKAKRIIRKLRLPREAARSQAIQAFGADLAAGRPHKALLCAREFDLGNSYLTQAAVELFIVLIKRARFADAYQILKGYSLLEAGQEAKTAIDIARHLDRLPSDLELEPDERLALRKILYQVRKVESRQLDIHDAERAIELIRKASDVREADPRVRGRSIILPAEGDLMLAGDFHGNTDNLLRLIQVADLDNHPSRILVIQEILHARTLTAADRDLSFVTIMHCLDLMLRYPGQIYYLIGNHDLGFHLGRDLVKAGKSLNRYLYRGLNFQFKDRAEQVAEEYKQFIAGMPAAIIAQNGIFMSHSTPKRSFIKTLSHDYLTETAASLPYSKCKPIVALVNGRDYDPETAERFADRLGCEHMICGHTPTVKGVRVPNKRHIIIDSQHANARYIHFDLDAFYTHDELVDCVEALQSETVPLEEVGELV